MSRGLAQTWTILMCGMRLLSSGHLSVPTMITVWSSWLDRMRGQESAAPLGHVMSCLMAVSIVSDRDPVATSSLSSLMKDNAHPRLAAISLSRDVFFLMLRDVKGRS